MKNKYSIYLILLSAVLWTSCEMGLDTVKMDSVVYLPQSGLTTQTALLGDSKFKLGVYNAGYNQNNPTVTVSIGIDQVAAAQFIAANPGYEILPANFYSLPDQTVLIGSGSAREYYHIELKGITEAFTDKMYILPISIKGVDSDAKIDSSKMVALLHFARFRNVYEAKYKAFGRAVLAGTVDTDLVRVDEELTSTSVDANTIQVKGTASGMNLLLKVQNGQVTITGAPGSEAFDIKNTSGKTNTYVGEFNQDYQCNVGTYTIYYTYTVTGKQMDVTTELKFTL